MPNYIIEIFTVTFSPYIKQARQQSSIDTLVCSPFGNDFRFDFSPLSDEIPNCHQSSMSINLPPTYKSACNRECDRHLSLRHDKCQKIKQSKHTNKETPVLFPSVNDAKCGLRISKGLPTISGKLRNYQTLPKFMGNKRIKDEHCTCSGSRYLMKDSSDFPNIEKERNNNCVPPEHYGIGYSTVNPSKQFLDREIFRGKKVS